MAPDATRHPFWLGGKSTDRAELTPGAAAMMSVAITHPVDQTKIRAQTQSVRRGMLATVRHTVLSDGLFGLWTGLSGSLLRQGTYGAARFGVYAKLKDMDALRSLPGEVGSRWGLVRNGAIAGMVAGVVGAPGGELL